MAPEERRLDLARRLDDAVKEQARIVRADRQTMADLPTVHRSLERSATGYLAVLGRLGHDVRVLGRRVRALEEIRDAAARGAFPAAAAALSARTIVRGAA